MNLTLPQTAGIAGGRPSSSYYFVGYQDSSLLYLDPHHVRPAVQFRYPPANLEGGDLEDWLCTAYPDTQLSTFHCDRVRKMPIKSLDPSMLLGYLVSDEACLEDLVERIRALPKPLFSIAELPPRWARGGADAEEDLDLAMESFSEGSFDGGDRSLDQADTLAPQDDGDDVRSLSSDEPETPSALGPRANSAGLGVQFPTMSSADEDEDDLDEAESDEPAGTGHGTGIARRPPASPKRTTTLRPNAVVDRIVSSGSNVSDATERGSSRVISSAPIPFPVIPTKYAIPPSSSCNNLPSSQSPETSVIVHRPSTDEMENRNVSEVEEDTSDQFAKLDLSQSDSFEVTRSDTKQAEDKDVSLEVDGDDSIVVLPCSESAQSQLNVVDGGSQHDLLWEQITAPTVSPGLGVSAGSQGLLDGATVRKMESGSNTATRDSPEEDDFNYGQAM